jgi:AcrR family transcriptional regulator
MKPKRKPHAETRKQNRDQILGAARVVFATIGFDAATVRDIVRESGLAQGSFYNYYRTKQDVFEDVVEDIIDPLVSLLRQTRADATTARAFLFNGYEACRLLPLQEPQAAAIIARNQSSFREIFYLGDGQSRIKSDLAADLKAGHRAGLFKSMDFELMAETQIALGIDLVIQAAQSPEHASKRVKFLSDLLEAAIAKQD